MFQDYMSAYLEQCQKFNQQWWQEFDRHKEALNTPLNKTFRDLNCEDFLKLFETAATQPATMLKVQMTWWEKQLKIWQNIALGDESETVVEADKSDKRFKDKAWQEEAFFNFIKQSYLLYSQTFLEMIDSIEGLDPKVKERLVFFSRQIINSMSPSNYILTNPELLKLTFEKNGENLVNGLQQLKKDIETSADVLRVSMTSSEAFQVGEQIASTPGNVVYKDELFELIQYHPLTEQVHATPLLVVPPFINKYYILDLREKDSMIRWLLEQGYPVFAISWRNPGAGLAEVGFEDYVLRGVVKAVSVIEEITGQPQVHAAGYCIGGTVLSCAVGYYAAKRMKPRIASASYFTTLLDFSQPGELGSFINEPLIAAIENQNNAKGYMDGRNLGVIFSLLRENSLYWNYFVEKYLKGNSPVDFDILYWNGDSTNVTAKCHNFLLRELYLNNKLIEPRGVKIGGVYVDLGKIKIPSYFIATRDDHIALWQGCYSGAQHVGGDKTFVLGSSGHIAGIINHPASNKYEYWTNDKLGDNPESWLDQAENHDGSWWLHWQNWLNQYSKEEMVAPYQQGSANHPVIGPAPGEYVHQRLPVEAVSA